MSDFFNKVLDGVKDVVLLGHIHPDGDCIGTCLGMYNYISENYPQVAVDLCLAKPADKFSYMKNFDRIKGEPEPERVYQLCITLDSSDEERLGIFRPYFESAGETLCIDHHVTNKGFAKKNHIVPSASSCSEVLYTLLDDDKVSRETAECLYTGIVHDTGVFKYSNTSRKTMEIAGILMEKGLNITKIIDDSFYRRTYVQNQLLGRALLESFRFLDGRCIFTALKQKEMDFYGADSSDRDGIIDQLRITEGVECAIFIFEKEPHVYKVSMRSNNYVDVSKIASYFGGGGHVRAAGCTMNGSAYDVLNNLSKHIEQQMKEHDNK